MVKKAIAIGAAGLMLLSVAGPVFAGWWWGGGNDVDIHNYARVSTKVYTKADSGDNSIGGKYVFGGRITTGAAGATADLYTDVNSSMLVCDGCDGDINIRNRAHAYTRVKTVADSGDNSIHGKCVGGGIITTGAATAKSIVDTIVNFTMVGITP